MDKSTSLTNTQTYIDVLKADAKTDDVNELRGAMALFEPITPRVQTAIIEKGFYNDRQDTSS